VTADRQRCRWPLFPPLTPAVPLRTGPAAGCPSCGTALDGGPVTYWCAPCRRGVHAADIDVTYRAPDRRAAA
jgi:hypothetical protein